MANYKGKYSEYIHQFKVGDKVKLLSLEDALEKLKLFSEEMTQNKYDDVYDAIINDYDMDAGNRHYQHAGKEFIISEINIHDDYDEENRIFYSDFTITLTHGFSLYIFFFCIEQSNTYKVELL